jgi:RimJ/RimL family protein N-acetyltransferase
MGYLGLDHIFTRLAIRKLCSEAFAFNNASIRYHETLGFSREGYFKEHMFKSGRYEDIVCFALFAERWQVVRTAVGQRCFGMGWQA